jgi:hypothetical protein
MRKVCVAASRSWGRKWPLSGVCSLRRTFSEKVQNFFCPHGNDNAQSKNRWSLRAESELGPSTTIDYNTGDNQRSTTSSGWPLRLA